MVGKGLRHVRTEWISGSRQACATDNSRTLTNLTASTLNLQLNFRLFIDAGSMKNSILVFKPAAAHSSSFPCRPRPWERLPW